MLYDCCTKEINGGGENINPWLNLFLIHLLAEELFLPKEVRYQAAPHTEARRVAKRGNGVKRAARRANKHPTISQHLDSIDWTQPPQPSTRKSIKSGETAYDRSHWPPAPKNHRLSPGPHQRVVVVGQPVCSR